MVSASVAGLVVSITLDAGEAQRDAAGVAARALHAVDRDLDDGDRLDPDRAGSAAHLDLLEALGLPAQQRIGQPLEGLADHHVAAGLAELTGRVERSEVQVRQQSGAPPRAPLARQHDEVVGVHGLHLDPARPASAGGVRRPDRLHDHALVSGRQGVTRYPLGHLGVARDLARDAVGRRDALEFGDADGQRFVEQVAPVEVEHVEEPRMQHRRAGGVGAERRHGLLERSRRSVLVESERLAVEDDVVDGHAAHDVDHLGQAVRDVGEVAGEDADVVARAVHLDAGAVEFELDGCLARWPRALPRRWRRFRRAWAARDAPRRGRPSRAPRPCP